jgi:hypothetical protein
MLNTCGQCGNRYGYDDKYLYGCDHHKVKDKGYPLPDDLLKVQGIITNTLMTKDQLAQHLGFPDFPSYQEGTDNFRKGITLHE